MNRYRKGRYTVTSAIKITLFNFCISLLLSLVPISSFAQQSSIDNAVQEVRTQTKGKIISADTVTIDNNQKHRIKVLMPNGHVKVFYKPVN